MKGHMQPPEESESKSSGEPVMPLDSSSEEGEIVVRLEDLWMPPDPGKPREPEPKLDPKLDSSDTDSEDEKVIAAASVGFLMQSDLDVPILEWKDAAAASVSSPKHGGNASDKGKQDQTTFDVLAELERELDMAEFTGKGQFSTLLTETEGRSKLTEVRTVSDSEDCVNIEASLIWPGASDPVERPSLGAGPLASSPTLYFVPPRRGPGPRRPRRTGWDLTNSSHEMSESDSYSEVSPRFTPPATGIRDGASPVSPPRFRPWSDLDLQRRNGGSLRSVPSGARADTSDVADTMTLPGLASGRRVQIRRDNERADQTFTAANDAPGPYIDLNDVLAPSEPECRSATSSSGASSTEDGDSDVVVWTLTTSGKDGQER
mmetsp:Transcript_31496/g.73879  ORF Transcript_31496/g.73879 Transcript_31496/m.73879 type:complete len:375 (+) Transcript_31496:2-1126(+)